MKWNKRERYIINKLQWTDYEKALGDKTAYYRISTKFFKLIWY